MCRMRIFSNSKRWIVLKWTTPFHNNPNSKNPWTSANTTPFHKSGIWTTRKTTCETTYETTCETKLETTRGQWIPICMDTRGAPPIQLSPHHLHPLHATQCLRRSGGKSGFSRTRLDGSLVWSSFSSSRLSTHASGAWRDLLGRLFRTGRREG